MEINVELRKQIFEIVENQIRNNDPPETKLTYNRLKELGYNDFAVKQLIGQCVAVELFDIFKSGKPFDEKRYVGNLKRLPDEPI
jgi:hypothetical protein